MRAKQERVDYPADRHAGSPKGHVALAVIGWTLKSRIEEGFMADQLGAEYSEYKRHVKRLIPFVW